MRFIMYMVILYIYMHVTYMVISYIYMRFIHYIVIFYIYMRFIYYMLIFYIFFTILLMRILVDNDMSNITNSSLFSLKRIVDMLYTSY